MREKQILQKNIERERERERERETFLWGKTMQRIKERMTNL